MANVRQYAEGISGFRDVQLRFRDVNNHEENLRESITEPLADHGSCIFLEDDSILSPKFLKFMNSALRDFRDHPEIISVSGYCPPVRPERYVKASTYLSKFFSAWSLGLWAHKGVVEMMDSPRPYTDMVERNLLREVKKIHPKLPRFLKEIEEGGFLAWDRTLSYFMIRDDTFQLKPTKTLVGNTGHDGSGAHSPKSSRFSASPFDGDMVSRELPRYAPSVDRQQYRFFYRRFTRANIEKHLRKFPRFPTRRLLAKER